VPLSKDAFGGGTHDDEGIETVEDGYRLVTYRLTVSIAVAAVTC
jgi:hypothetical protein